MLPYVFDSTAVKVVFPQGVTAWISVAGGQYYTLALGNDGNIYSWGLNDHGELGVGTTVNDSLPEKVIMPAGVTRWTSIAAGGPSAYAIAADGSLYSWGSNGFGQLGNGSTSDSYSPVKVIMPAGVNAIAISAPSNSAMAIGSDGNLYTWGRNGDAQLGTGNTTDKNSLVQFNYQLE